MRTIGKYKGKRSIKQLDNVMSMKVTMKFLAPRNPLLTHLPPLRMRMSSDYMIFRF